MFFGKEEIFNSFIERQIVPFDDRQGCFRCYGRVLLMVVGGGGGGGQLAAMSPLPTSSNRSSSSLADSHKLFFILSFHAFSISCCLTLCERRHNSCREMAGLVNICATQRRSQP